jgi:DNA-binding NarL/FixJ family response regulator
MPGFTLNDRHLDALRGVVEASTMTSSAVALPWEVLDCVSSLLCWRHPGRDFTERERFDLQLLMPHIEASYRRSERQRATPEITARQRELLEFVRDGFTNQQIGRRMGLSEGTIRPT